MNFLNRPYDIVIPGDQLTKILARRRSPDGLPHTVKETVLGHQKRYLYPFAKMELGDFFIAPIADRSEKSMRTAFVQAAARHDLEIAVTNWKLPGGAPALRVTVVIIGVTKWKRALDLLLDEDELLPEDQQKYRHVPRPRYSALTTRKKANRKAAKKKPVPKSRQKTRKKSPEERKKHDPFWADKDPNVNDPMAFAGLSFQAPKDPTIRALAAEPERHLSREEILQRALAESER